ncbi:MAG: 4-(cytidine 5'-diphospho)-2-C-methyl-D-erythritol kinase [Nocardioidaceae bacterium]
MATTVTVRTPAKINLGLRVGAPGDDGYHPLATVYQAISLYDEIRAHPAPAGQITAQVTGEGEDNLVTDATNLAVQAARLLAKTYDVSAGAALAIHKTIAVAGGLAGGSADAAAALLACDALWGTRASRDELLELAARLGSDVPFCLVGGNAVGSGRGERVSPVLARGSYEWVLAYADGGLSTPEVYTQLDRQRGKRTIEDPEVSDDLMTALRSGDAYAVGLALHNDLQAPAIRLRPSLARTLEVGEEFGALGTMVAGSGPTCVFLASEEEHAVDLAVALTGSGLCRAVQRAGGPVAGARVVT